MKTWIFWALFVMGWSLAFVFFFLCCLFSSTYIIDEMKKHDDAYMRKIFSKK